MVATLPANRFPPLATPAPAAPPKPAAAGGEPEAFRRHVQETFDVSSRREAAKPEAQRRTVTLQWQLATGFVEQRLRDWDLRASDIAAGDFIATVLRLQADH